MATCKCCKGKAIPMDKCTSCDGKGNVYVKGIKRAKRTIVRVGKNSA